MFDEDTLARDGRTLDPVCRDPGDPCDALLRWHFQTVCACEHEIGQSAHDFVYKDMVKEITEVRLAKSDKVLPNLLRGGACANQTSLVAQHGTTEKSGCTLVLQS